MTDDLTTLLRDAGRAPTVDLDVDTVHDRGRRRTVVRRSAVGVGALVLLGVLGVGVTNLLDTPDAPIVDQAPGDGETEDTAPQDAVVDGGLVTAAGLARAHGVTVHELGFDAEDFDGFELTVTTPDGVETGRWVEDATQLRDPVVADDGGIWAMTPDGRTVRRDPGTGEVMTVNQTGLQTGWLPVGRYDDGRGSVLVVEVGLGDTTLAEASSVYVATADGALPFAPFPAVDERWLGPAETVTAAAAADERLVVVAGEVEGTRVVLLPSGRPSTVLVDVTENAGARIVDAALVGDEAWVVTHEEGGGPSLLRMDLDRLEAVDVPLPGEVMAVDSVAVATNGSVVALGARTADETPVTYVLDVARVRSGATVESVRLETAAHVDLLPWSGTRPAPAACADQPLNPTPRVELSVWFLCWDAAGELPQDAAHPFVHGEDRFAGADVVAGAPGIRVVLDAWAAGPTTAEAASGLTGGLDPEVARIGDVAIDGTTVTVDLAPGPQVGVLGTTTGRATTVQAIVGAVLQFDGHGDLALDEVVLTLDGSCEDWAAVAEAGGCPTYAETLAPWAQG